MKDSIKKHAPYIAAAGFALLALYHFVIGDGVEALKLLNNAGAFLGLHYTVKAQGNDNAPDKKEGAV